MRDSPHQNDHEIYPVGFCAEVEREAARLSAVRASRAALGRKIVRPIGSVDGVGCRVPVVRPFICRVGLHRWTRWDLTIGEDRWTLNSVCSRCGARRVMVFKDGEPASRDRALCIAARLRRAR